MLSSNINTRSGDNGGLINQRNVVIWDNKHIHFVQIDRFSTEPVRISSDSEVCTFLMNVVLRTEETNTTYCSQLSKQFHSIDFRNTVIKMIRATCCVKTKHQPNEYSPKYWNVIDCLHKTVGTKNWMLPAHILTHNKDQATIEPFLWL